MTGNWGVKKEFTMKSRGLTNLTVDKVTARQSLVALELLIEQVRSVCGQLVVSAANGKIKQGSRHRLIVGAHV